MENCVWAEECGSLNCSPSEMHSDGALMIPWLPSGEQTVAAEAEALQYGYSQPASIGLAEDRNASASRSHSEAEKRRRDRINAQLAALRKLIPKSDKMDKAALLGHVVNQVKEESKRAKEATKFSTIPAETDQVIIDHLNAEESTSHNIYMKASICCEDRPEFFAELNSALRGLGLTIVEAEVTTLGGRMRTNFIVCGKEQSSCTTPLQQSLKLALSRIVISSGSSSYSARSKRQRFFYPDLH